MTDKENKSNNNSQCFNETQPLRDLLKPIATDFTKHVYDKYLEYALDVNKKDGVTDYMVTSGMCLFLGLYAEHLDFVNSLHNHSQLLLKMFEVLGGDIGKYPDIEQSLQDIQLHFETVEPLEVFSNGTFQKNFHSQGCKEFLQVGLTSVSKAALMTLLHFDIATETDINIENVKYINENLQGKIVEVLKQNHFLHLISEEKYNEVEKMRYMLKHGEILDKNITCFDQDNKSTMAFPMCKNPTMHHKECCEMEEKIMANYRSLLKFYKFTEETSVAQIQDASHYNEVNYALTDFEVKGYKRKDSLMEFGELRNIDPIIIACSYGTPTFEVSANCPHFTRSFTSTGLGYSFNQVPFQDMYQKTDWSEAFYKELVMKVNNTAEESRNIAKPALNGPGFSMSMILKTPISGPGIYKYVFFGQRTLSVGSPYSIPNLSGEGIVLSPGLHYTVMVTPTVTKINDNLIDFAPSDRGCIHKTDKHNLTIFANYTYENCLFECHLIRAAEECGCIPINFPRIADYPLCSTYVTLGGHSCFSRVLHSSQDPKSCSHCMVDCESVSYSYNVLTKPMDIIHMCPFNMKVRMQSYLCLAQMFTYIFCSVRGSRQSALEMAAAVDTKSD